MRETRKAPFTVVEFKTVYKGGKQYDMVLLAPVGEGYDRSQTWERIESIRPKFPIPENPEDEALSTSQQAMLARWEIIGPRYTAWRESREIPEDGIPLGAWSGCTADQAAFLRKMGILTVEALAEATEPTVQRFPWPNARRLPQMAKEFLDGRPQAEMQAELAEANERIAAMEELLNEMTASRAEVRKEDKKEGRKVA